jgi:hypothetical protein
MHEKTPKTTGDGAVAESETAPQATSGVRKWKGEKPARPVEIGGRQGPDPTRYGDWEKNGRCIDF